MVDVLGYSQSPKSPCCYCRVRQKVRRVASLPFADFPSLSSPPETYGAVGGDLVSLFPPFQIIHRRPLIFPPSYVNLQGTRVLTKLLRQFPKNAVAAHYTMLYGKPPFGFLFDYLPLPTSVLNWWKQLGVTDPERNALRGQERFLSNGKGYNILQKTRPATIGYALYGEYRKGEKGKRANGKRRTPRLTRFLWVLICRQPRRDPRLHRREVQRVVGCQSLASSYDYGA